MNIENALKACGEWSVQPCELEWLAYQAARHTCILEVGSWTGASTRALAENTTGHVWAVDTWQKYGWEENWTYLEFLRNLMDLKNIHAIRIPSVLAASVVKGLRYGSLRFDMLFIDGDHAYESVRDDIAAWFPLLDKGGLVCGHDYNMPQVARAVDELIPGILMGAGCIWHKEI